jgi:hypothetical protein
VPVIVPALPPAAGILLAILLPARSAFLRRLVSTG